MIRIRLSRVAGWHLPLGARSVAFPTRWVNPARPAKRSPEANALAVECYRVLLAEQLAADPDWIEELRNATALACWCPLDWPCHANVLIEALAASSRAA